MAPNPLASLPVIEPLTRPWSPSWKYYSNISKQFEEILLNNISDDLHKKVFLWAVSEKGEGGGTYQNFWYFSISPTVGGCELGGLRSSSPSQGQVHRGAAEVNLDLTRGT